MVSIQRQTRFVAATHDAALLKLLLNRVMTRLTQRLKILRVEELGFVTTVRLDVIHDVGCGDTSPLGAELAEWLFLKLVIAQPVPRLRPIKMSISSCSHC